MKTNDVVNYIEINDIDTFRNIFEEPKKIKLESMNYKYGTRIKLPRITSILQTNFYAQYERERDCLKHTLQYPVHVHDGLSDSKAI